MSFVDKPHECDLPFIVFQEPAEPYFECDYCKRTWKVTRCLENLEKDLYYLTFESVLSDRLTVRSLK